jgi:putative endonuclease
MSGKTRFETGLAAEDLAARWYEARGGRVLERRFRGPEGEIDLIIDAPGALVFVEVKARRSSADAAWALTAAQMTRIVATAERYLAAVPSVQGRTTRFDVVLADRSGEIQVIENAIVG